MLLPREIRLLANHMEKAGYDLYLVGGSVRDFLLHKEPLEFDFEIFAGEDRKMHLAGLNKEEQEAYREATIREILSLITEVGQAVPAGKSFGVYKIAGKPYDFCFPRTEVKIGNKHQDFQVFPDPFISVEQAQKRRDLTINAIYYQVSRDRLADFHGGKKDLRQQVLRHVDATTFPEDPLRVYRVAQFVSRLGFQVAPETMELCREMDISALSLERIHWEMEKFWTGRWKDRGIQFFYESHILRKRHKILHDLVAAADGSLMERINRVLAESADPVVNWTVLLNSLLWDLPEENREEKIGQILASFTPAKKIRQEVLQHSRLQWALNQYLEDKKSLASLYFQAVGLSMPTVSLLFKSTASLQMWPSELEERGRQALSVLDSLQPAITGKDLKDWGYPPSSNYKEMLAFALELQCAGAGCEEIKTTLKSRYQHQ